VGAIRGGKGVDVSKTRIPKGVERNLRRKARSLSGEKKDGKGKGAQIHVDACAEENEFGIRKKKKGKWGRIWGGEWRELGT